MKAQSSKKSPMTWMSKRASSKTSKKIFHRKTVKMKS
jgi:hypothetical protein